MGCAQGMSSEDMEIQQAALENKDFEEIMHFLQKVALLKRLPRDEYAQLAAAFKPANYTSGDIVIRQGDVGSEFFVIRSGEATVSICKEGITQKVMTLKGGDYFGEKALLVDEPRTATISAETDLCTVKISREEFQSLGLHKKLVFANRKAVVAGNQGPVQQRAATPKNAEETKFITDAIKANKNLKVLLDGHLGAARIEQMVSIAWKDAIPAHEDVITKGDMTADYFYIVQSGEFDVFEGERVGELEHAATIAAGGSFGELALLYSVPRAATVRAQTDAVVWVIDRANFKKILMQASDQVIQKYEEYLSRVGLLSALLAEERSAVARALSEKAFSSQDVILQQGDEGHTFFILYEGEVSISKDGVVVSKRSASGDAQAAHIFGERSLLTNEPCTATVKVTSTVAKALALDRVDFERLLGPLQDIINPSQVGGRQSQLGVNGLHGARPSQLAGNGRRGGRQSQLALGLRHSAQPKRERILKKDLFRIGLLGCGGFGAVELWGHRKTDARYALKAISKGFIMKAGMQESVLNERNVSLALSSPFIVTLFATYNGSQSVYFLLEAVTGGELYDTYNRKSLHGSELYARFYLAGVVFAFEHLHERRIVYRDLKPENLILTGTGYIKLTDMGLAKFVIGRTFTMCGTPDYFAPEIIKCTGHTEAVDWWTWGVLMFELLTGSPPFECNNPMETYAKAVKGIDRIPFAGGQQAKDLIHSVMAQNPGDRIPMRAGGTRNIKDAPWYGGFAWDDMEALTMEPPYVPTIKTDEEFANASEDIERPPHMTFRDDGSGWDLEFAS